MKMNPLEAALSELKPRWVETNEQYRMMCPFRENHDDDNDGSNSFFVTPGINAYHCFSCKAHGRLLNLLTVHFHVPFSEALEMVVLDNLDTILFPKDRIATEVTDIIPMTPPPAFIKRGFGERLLRQFNIGYEVNDRGQDQIFIPIYDNDGSKVVAIKNRVDRNFWYAPKAFPKEKFLYNYHRVAGKYKTCVLVEGETDVVQSCKNGVWNVVGHMGGQLSDEQAQLMTVFDEVYLAEDNDKQGFKNTETAYEKLCTIGPEIKVMLYDSEDPGKCEASEWLRAYEEVVTYAEYRFRMSMEFGNDYTKLLKRGKK
jgi:DNA primase